MRRSPARFGMFEQRIEQLDTLAVIPLAGRSTQPPHLLTDDDVETLRHLATEGMGDNTMSARLPGC